MKYHVSIFILAISLMACSSPSPLPQKQLYLLDTVPSQNVELFDDALISVKVTGLPNYLNQSALVMMTGTHQLEMATNHAWADRLSNSIERVVRYEYSRALQTSTDQNKCTQLCRVSLTIEHFYPSVAGDVFLVGNYSLTQTEGGTINRQFNLQGQIQSDGYIGAVEEMRALLVRLSQQIAEQ